MTQPYGIQLTLERTPNQVVYAYVRASKAGDWPLEVRFTGSGRLTVNESIALCDAIQDAIAFVLDGTVPRRRHYTVEGQEP